MKTNIHHADCLDHMQGMPIASVDLVFCSPPYESQRTYGIEFDLKGDDWVQWAADRFEESHNVCRGLTAWVVQGYTRQFEWSASPALLIAELKSRGVKLRNPPVYKRNGIPGSGGPDWLRGDYEWIICASHGKLPWSDNTAMGHPPKYGAGGSPSHRQKNGKRVGCKSTDRRKDGSLAPRVYKPPKLSNPGNVIDCGSVGGGNCGSKLAHENEAPFPEQLAEFFIRSFCPPDGTVLDPFSGSGTTAAMAIKNGRNAIAIDCRESQCDLTKRRIEEVGLVHQKAKASA